MSLFDEIKQKLAEIQEITREADHITEVMKNPNSTNADLEQAVQSGIEKLNEIENRRNSQ